MFCDSGQHHSPKSLGSMRGPSKLQNKEIQNHAITADIRQVTGKNLLYQNRLAVTTNQDKDCIAIQCK